MGEFIGVCIWSVLGLLLLGIIVFFIVQCIRALNAVAELHSDLNKIAEEIKFLRRRDDVIELNNRTANTEQN